MSELLIELFSEEMPPNLQINARNQFKKFFDVKKEYKKIFEDLIKCNVIFFDPKKFRFFLL